MAIATIAIMYASFLAVGWLAARKVKEGTAAELIVAGRAMPLWIATLTMTGINPRKSGPAGSVKGTVRGPKGDRLTRDEIDGMTTFVSMSLEFTSRLTTVKP